MKTNIILAHLKYINDCVSALMNSQLGEEYFTELGATKEITKGINNKQIYVSVDSEENFLGFVWGLPDSAFHIYPYLHIVAVKESYRGNGIGKQLIQYCEDIMFEEEPKVFLTVGEYNLKAKKLYEQLGYQQVGIIPNLFKEGVTEYLMMKVKK